MDGFFDLFSILLACYGVYFLYLWFRTAVLKQPMETNKNVLPTDLTMKTCSDPERFTAFILPWLFITGLSLLGYATISYFFDSETWFIIVGFVYFAAVLTYYILMIRTARRRFWPDTVKVKEKKRK